MNIVKYSIEDKTTSYTLFNRVVSELNKYDPALYELLQQYPEDIAIAGGSLRSIISKTPIQDIDFYITNLDILLEITEFLIDYGYKVVCNSNNALTFKSPYNKTVQVIQKVLLNASDPTDLFDEFDFTITQAMFYADTLYLGETFLEDLASRSLIIKNKKLKYPIATLVRTLKYQRYGFTITPMLMVNIALQIHTLDISTYAQLKDQLQGIDTTIFDAVIKGIGDQIVFTVPDFLSHLEENYFNYLEN